MNYLLGHSFGRYHIIERLGEGGMATTFKAYDTHKEKYVALIVVRVVKELSEAQQQRLTETGKRLKQLSHPNLISVLDFGIHKGMPYLVTQYENVHSLKHHSGLPLTPKKAAELLVPIARALEYLHNEGMIHGDVKPSNILISNDKKPLLADVGATRVIEIAGKENIPDGGLGFGTPAYMAPEQVSGEAVDQRTDIYALGIVFFELITAQKPHDADTPLAVLAKQVHDPLIRPSKLNPAIPDHVEQIIYKATAKNPEDRFQTMGAFAKRLEGLIEEDKTEQMILPQSHAPSQKQPSAPPPAPPIEKPSAKPPQSYTPPPMPVYVPPVPAPAKKFPWIWLIIVFLLLTLCVVICILAAIAFGLLTIPGGFQSTASAQYV